MLPFHIQVESCQDL